MDCLELQFQSVDIGASVSRYQGRNEWIEQTSGNQFQVELYLRLVNVIAHVEQRTSAACLYELAIERIEQQLIKVSLPFNTSGLFQLEKMRNVCSKRRALPVLR